MTETHTPSYTHTQHGKWPCYSRFYYTPKHSHTIHTNTCTTTPKLQHNKWRTLSTPDPQKPATCGTEIDEPPYIAAQCGCW